jgi:hypothetical protein
VSEIVPTLVATPGIRAVAVFEELCRRHPEIAMGVRRTLERRIARWRALNGRNRPQRVVRTGDEDRPERVGAAGSSRARRETFENLDCRELCALSELRDRVQLAPHLHLHALHGRRRHLSNRQELPKSSTPPTLSTRSTQPPSMYAV